MKFPVDRKELVANEMIYGMRAMPMIYILKCKNNKIYIGWTNNLNKRMYDHLLGCKGSYFTYKYEPIELEAALMVPIEYTPQQYEVLVYEEYKKMNPNMEVSMGQYDKFTEDEEESTYETEYTESTYETEYTESNSFLG
jgi:predicted GIY-YIG superfamily endonuclease